MLYNQILNLINSFTQPLEGIRFSALLKIPHKQCVFLKLFSVSTPLKKRYNKIIQFNADPESQSNTNVVEFHNNSLTGFCEVSMRKCHFLGS